jgi:hypothetical protein
VREILRRRIFEFENSLAMYQLLEGIFAFDQGKKSNFGFRFGIVLQKLRKRFNKKIALLAVTDEKFEAMKASEFGMDNGQNPSNDLVEKLSGFDRFFSPQQFRAHVEKHGECKYLLYVRASDPLSKLKKPGTVVDHPLLGDSKMRKVIKANTLTFNIDRPGMDYANRINDTKDYQSRMGMAFPAGVEADLFTLAFTAHLFSGEKYEDYQGKRLSPEFEAYLKDQWIDPQDINSGNVLLRGKPMKCAYGCYGHVVGFLNDRKFRSELRRNVRLRNRYVIQPEMSTPHIVNRTNGIEYDYIDRNFFAAINGQPKFLGGFRSLMPVDSHECKQRRNHGNCRTVWAEIT